MTKKGWIIMLIYFIILAVSLTVIFFGRQFFAPKEVHYHAGFIVVKNNKQVDFTGVKYMNAKLCGKNQKQEEKLSPEEEQMEKAHLHDYIGDVVHVHRDNALWKDLFTNLKYPINYHDVSAYENGEKVANFESLQIHPYDSVVVFIGKNKDINKFLSKAVTKQHIITVEKRSESCGGS